MIIWKGWGILAVLILLVCSVLVELASDAMFGAGFYKSSAMAMPLAFVLSAGIVYIVGVKLNNRPGKILIDPENNQETELKTTHSMFWIPMQYWSFIFVALALWMYLSNIGVA
ncbi:hypothetical protein [Sulfuricurvum sp.]|uniref:hypothetical protein n=1 Tax=Sulfuricurvum sp. TaxID=2025608 RepID=UPI002622CC39|nr:hypothetical protein [Sulfuricurvum sp.]MDD3598331.1 hypothetical protein [Sulfuricurvum sp.]